MLSAACAALVGAVLAPAANGHDGAHPEAFSHAQLEQALGDDPETTEEGLYEVEARGPDLLTHGPDLQLAAGGSASQIGFRSGDPERAPICSDGYRQHVLYAYVSGSTDRFATSVEPIRAAMRRANAVLNAASLESGGGSADYLMACDDARQIRVDSVVVPDAGFGSVVSAARAAGFNAPNVDYTVFLDASNGGACGIGSYYADESSGADNQNNNGGGYGVTYRGCWFNETPMHENAHNQGAVQYSAPQSTGNGGHCWEEIDVMCYAPDGGNLHQEGTVTNCADRAYFDCGYDTYFDSAPEPGEYLASNWNLGSPLNRFIAFNGATAMPDPAPAAPAPSTSEPVPPPPPTETPQPPTPTDPAKVPLQKLANGAPRQGLSWTTGGWREYAIAVPQKRRSLKVELSTPCIQDCDLDLYLRRARKPSLRQFDCAPSGPGSSERCRIDAPRRGRWFVGVYASDAEAPVSYRVRAKHRRA